MDTFKGEGFFSSFSLVFLSYVASVTVSAPMTSLQDIRCTFSRIHMAFNRIRQDVY